MEVLYHELWGKQLDVIKDREFSIAQPGRGFRLAYKVDLGEMGDEAFTDPAFAKGVEERVFKVLKVRSRLPCGTNKLLVRREFETTEQDLLRAESEKWSVVNSRTGRPMPDLNLDFQIAGQPGSGAYYLY